MGKVILFQSLAINHLNFSPCLYLLPKEINMCSASKGHITKIFVACALCYLLCPFDGKVIIWSCLG